MGRRRGMRTSSSLLPLFLAVLAASACASPGSAPRPVATGAQPVPWGPVHDQASADTLARALVDRVSLPPGSRLLTAPPSRGLGTPPEQPETPDLADAVRFAVVPLDSASTLDFARAHPPGGYTTANSGSGTTSGPDQPTEQFLTQNVSGMPAGVDSAAILIAVVDSGSSESDVRIDAEVTWLPSKPAWLTVPANDAAVVVALKETQAPQPPDIPAPRTVTITDPTMVDRLRTAADGLQPALPGTRNCPADLGTRYNIDFKPTPADPPNISFTAGNCDEVTVTGPDGSTSQLGDDAASRARTGARSGCRPPDEPDDDATRR